MYTPLLFPGHSIHLKFSTSPGCMQFWLGFALLNGFDQKSLLCSAEKCLVTFPSADMAQKDLAVLVCLTCSHEFVSQWKVVFKSHCTRPVIEKCSFSGNWLSARKMDYD